MPDRSVTLSQLLAERLVAVPGYQRGYAWEDRQLSEFLEDLDVLDEGDGAFRNHYTGTVVLLSRPSVVTRMDATGNVLTEVDVVDGQQRLTTIIILLAALAQRLRAHNDRLANGIVERFVEVPLRTGEVVPKIKLAGSADQFFRTRILKDRVVADRPETAGEGRLLFAKERLTSYVDRLAMDGPEALAGLYEKLSQHLKFNEYVVESDAEAGVIFETVNARGKPLTELELVKNYLMFASNWVGRRQGAQLEELINGTWAEIYTQLMKAELVSADREDQLLRAHWLMEYDPNVRFQGSRSVKERFSLRKHAQEPERLADAIGRFAESLAPSAVAFCELVKPDRDHTFDQFPPGDQEQARHAVRKLNSAGNPAVFRPLLMAARLDPTIAPPQFTGLVNMCECLSFRLYRVLSARSDTATGSLARTAYDLRHGVLTGDSTMERLRSIVHAFAPDASVFGALETVAPSWYSWWGLRYFLYEWEAHLTGAKQMAHDWGDVDARPRRRTVEHILPQEPKGQWLVDFPEPFERSQLTHTLGNLMLTWDNERYSNKEYVDKRGGEDSPPEAACYFHGSFKQEVELAARYPTWTPETIRHRQARLVEFARKRWAVDPPRDPAAEPVDEVEEEPRDE